MALAVTSRAHVGRYFTVQPHLGDHLTAISNAKRSLRKKTASLSRPQQFALRNTACKHRIYHRILVRRPHDTPRSLSWLKEA